MKSAFTLLIAMCMLTPATCQTKTDINELSASEVRSFLLKLEDDDPAKILVKKHNKSRTRAYSFLAASLISAVISTSSSDPDNNTNSILFGLSSGTFLILGGINGITASEQLKKAKSTYLNVTETKQNESISYLRDESDIFHSIFKYPRTR